MKIIIGSDHAGLELKNKIKAHLTGQGHEVEDLGTDSPGSVDYPEFGFAVANKVKETGERGIVVCGSGIGISIAANRVPGIRAALCHNEDTARMAREHNDANVLALGGRVVDHDLALKLVDIFLTTEFAGDRHARRVAQLDAQA